MPNDNVSPTGFPEGRNILKMPRWRTARYGFALAAAAVVLLLMWPGLAANLFTSGFGEESFMPHGHCYLWVPSLVWLHVGTDTLIGFSYVAISCTLAYLVHQARQDIPFHWVFLAFGLFIIACGMTHFMEVWTLWNATYWLSGYVKLVTAAASVATAIVLPPLVPKTLALVQAARLSEARKSDLERANVELEALRQREGERLQQELQASEARFSRLVQSNLIGVIMADRAGNITEANDAFLRMVGYTREDLLSGELHLDEMTPPEYRTLDLQRIEEDKSGVANTPWEKEYIRKDGGRIPVLVGFAPLEDAKDETVAFVLDLTERKRMEEEKARLLDREQKLRAEAEQANRLKDEFLATASHELRTPLTSIVGWTKMLRMEKFDAATLSRALETIERNADAQTRLVEDLLDISRIITGKLNLNTLPVEMALVANTAVNTVRPAADAKNIVIEMTFDAQAGPVLADASRLQQVIWNLLSNAVKFTPKDGRVQVSVRRVESQVEVSVRDTGEGIEPEFLPYVFDRFRQADGSMTRTHGGLGLGLAIVRHVVEMHGGKVSAHSEGAGRGATFSVRLPLLGLYSRVENPAISLEQGTGEATETQPGVNYPPNLAGVRVLVVDDDPDTREMLAAFLSRADADVVTASTAAEALREIERRTPDVLVSDIGMPEIDGYELIEKVRALETECGGEMIPALALTAYAKPEDRARALEAGYQVHLSKPVEPAELKRAVANLAGRANAFTDVAEADNEM